MEINRIVKLMAKPSKSYNPSGYLNASTRDNITLEVLSQWAECSKVYLESSTYHDDKVKISGNYQEIPFWQTNSDDYSIASSINIKNGDIWKVGSTAQTFNQSGIIALARDNDAVSALFENNYQWSMPNPRARINSYGFDFERGYCVEPHANFVVFVASDEVTPTVTLSGCTATYSGDWVVGNTVTITITPTVSGKPVSTHTATVGASTDSISAKGTGADAYVFEYTVPVGLSAMAFTCATS